ncbi:hypothetical protein HWV62_11131 [Athelia sp. TMB]|nr:hypothetical protein HWV62_11131 [Athelia sp. TMB]
MIGCFLWAHFAVLTVSSVLNVPKTATQNDIRERHRALSVIFHPDKQLDETKRGTASHNFLAIQKAYEGEDGLKISWPAELRSKSNEEIVEVLKRTKRTSTQRKLEGLIRSKGSLVCGINASSLLRSPSDVSLAGRLNRVSVMNIVETHRVKAHHQKDVTDKTTIGISTRITREVPSSMGLIGTGNVLGHFTHRASPKLEFEGAVSLMYPRFIILKSLYRPDDFTTLGIDTEIIPAFFFVVRPPITFNLTRRLSRDSLTDGRLTARIGRNPRVSLNITTPIGFDFTGKRKASKTKGDPSHGAGSVSGLAVGTRYFSWGVTLAGLSSNLGANVVYTFTELALQARLSLEYGLGGLAMVLRGEWEGETSSVAAGVGLSKQGVMLNLELTYLEQQLYLPIVLSQEYDAALGLCTAVLPSAAFVLGYHFILKPRRRAERAAILQKARLAADEDRAATKRQWEETIYMLKDTARKHMDAERCKTGLVIVDAFYGPSDPEDEAQGLVLDVTTAVQSLVTNSQLYIAGHRTKSGIQGFYDPAPSFAKSLRINYLFRGRPHFADVPDHRPVVLPLEGESTISNSMAHTSKTASTDHLV